MYNEDIIDDIKERMDELVGLTKTRKEASLKNKKMQLQVKILYNKKIMNKKFEIKDLVLMWNARIEDKGKHGEFYPIWLGPYLVETTWGGGSYILKD